MSKSRANELLQELHSNLTANWTGKARFSSSDAIKMCREIVYEYDNDDSNRDNTADSVSADGEQGLILTKSGKNTVIGRYRR